MGWGFRKSFGSGPFRVNLTHRGIGFSTGVKGFRISTNGRGTFVNVGAGGVYYRKKIGGPFGQPQTRSSPSAQPSPSQPASSPSTAHLPGAVQSASAAHLVDQRSEQLITAINETIGAPGFMRIVLPIAIVSTVVATLLAPVTFFFVALLWIAPLLFVHQTDRKSRTYSLLYELDQDSEAKWKELSDRLRGLSSARSIWRVAAVVSTSDWKRNAGAQELVSRAQASLTQRCPPYIESNVIPWCLLLNDQALYFYPDRLLILQGNQVGAVEYDRLSVSVTSESFIESGQVPPDAQIVGNTFLYVNKDGSPDRRFSNNRQIPIARYARMVFSSQSGLNIHLHVSSQAAANAFTGWSGVHRNRFHSPGPARSYHASAQSSTSQPPAGGRGRAYVPGEAMGYATQAKRQHPGSDTHAPPAPPSGGGSPLCYRTLGLAVGCSKEDASTAYRRLALKYHPDVVMNMPTDLREIAEERMKEVNLAYEELRRTNGW